MISDIIKEIRDDNKLTQKQLGELIGVTQQVIDKWEKNLCLPNTTSILSLYSVFGITPNELLGIEQAKVYKINNSFNNNNGNINIK